MKTLIIIPTYNERDNIEELVYKILESSPEVHILVVDDNSLDGTGGMIGRIESKIENLHLMTRKTQRGRGSAIIAGFRFAIENKFDYVIEMDADFSHNPKYIPLFLEKMKNADIVIGSRLIKTGAIVGRSMIRDIISSIANFIARLILGLMNIKDITSGYRCYRTEIFKEINLDKMISTGPSLLEEILYIAKKHKFKIVEMPIVFEERKAGKSKLNFAILLGTLLTVAKLRLVHHE